MDKFTFYRQKARAMCQSEIKNYHNVSRSFFMARLGGREMALFAKEVECVKTQTISSLMKALTLKEHFEIRNLLDDEGEIRSLPDFFKSCLYKE